MSRLFSRSNNLSVDAHCEQGLAFYKVRALESITLKMQNSNLDSVAISLTAEFPSPCLGVLICQDLGHTYLLKS